MSRQFQRARRGGMQALAQDVSRVLAVRNKARYLQVAKRGAYAVGAGALGYLGYKSAPLVVAKYKKRRQMKSLKIGQKYLKKRIRNNEGVITYRNRILKSATTAGINTCHYNTTDGNTVSIVELALAELRYFDPSTPGTFITTDLTSGTNYKQTICQSFSKFEVMNNYLIPCKVSVYKLVPKEDTAISPTTAITNGFADVGGLSNTNPQTFPTDSNLFNKLWKIQKTLKKVLYPGQMCKMSHATKEFSFDPAFVDTHNFAYQKKYGGHAYLIKIEGLVTHDTVVTTENATTQGAVDIQIDRTIKVTYDAGIDLRFYVAVTDAQTLTNGGVLSQRNVKNQDFIRS